MKKIFCFGELLLRFSPHADQKWIQDESMPVYIGGAELNTATALTKWGLPVSYLTALPENSLARDIIAHLRILNIETDKVVIAGNRIGTYYLPQGTDLKHAGVIYDRAHSSFSELKPGQIDWDFVLNDISWFHFSAITPALNQNLANVCKEALLAASKKRITISVDLNYRAKLWQYGKQPGEIMPDLVQYANVIMGNLWAEARMLNIKNEAGHSKNEYLKLSADSSAAIMEKFPNCRQVANTFRFDQKNGINYYATLQTKEGFSVSREYNTDSIADKVGSGDCFMAGLIYGNINNLKEKEIIDFSSAAAFSKLFIKGDSTTLTAKQIKDQYLNYV
ncbi:MAG TPA: sugar kinase [Flavisolibacter sp.]|jgi:2-dehydro-3-deoxygluconokinase|nr:sugar kinase [Flavisolibacter sp.]